ncbi:ATG27 [Candida oxycetoniae]|uniref:Autophagy-related protein 27 n=1 Tax=Candida oxycetoniae TaxID=497107 RepID=A0AAI9SZZ4_9ASCO|nr:ATG27 [Candida oxycetoniae]KAI3406117.2 ATG27 [Candida oxycetoniae]
MLIYVLVSLTVAFTSVAIDCSSRELQKYDLQSIKGTHSFITTDNTPPTKREMTWNIGICDSVRDVPGCPENSEFCVITKVLSDNESPVISEIIAFSSDTERIYSPENHPHQGFRIRYEPIEWGDSIVSATLEFVCEPDVNTGVELVWHSSNERKLNIRMVTKAVCLKNDQDKNPKDDGESWGWFTWIFIFLVLFLSIYIIGGAWFQYNKGNAIDFQSALKEVIENFLELLSSLPSFIREIIEKFTRSGNRGEYSAV